MQFDDMVTRFFPGHVTPLHHFVIDTKPYKQSKAIEKRKTFSDESPIRTRVNSRPQSAFLRHEFRQQSVSEKIPLRTRVRLPIDFVVVQSAASKYHSDRNQDQRARLNINRKPQLEISVIYIKINKTYLKQSRPLIPKIFHLKCSYRLRVRAKKRCYTMNTSCKQHYVCNLRQRSKAERATKNKNNAFLILSNTIYVVSYAIDAVCTLYIYAARSSVMH